MNGRLKKILLHLFKEVCKKYAEQNPYQLTNAQY